MLYYNENENILLRLFCFMANMLPDILWPIKMMHFRIILLSFYSFSLLVADYRWGSILILNCVAFNSNFMQIILERFALKISKRKNFVPSERDLHEAELK